MRLDEEAGSAGEQPASNKGALATADMGEGRPLCAVGP